MILQISTFGAEHRNLTTHALYFVPPTSDFPTWRSHVPTQGIVEEQRLSLKNQVEELEGKTAEREKHEREKTLAIK